MELASSVDGVSHGSNVGSSHFFGLRQRGLPAGIAAARFLNPQRLTRAAVGLAVERACIGGCRAFWAYATRKDASVIKRA